MPLYSYSGPVLEFDRIVANNWQAQTYTTSEAKARANLAYQFKKTYGKGDSRVEALRGVDLAVNKGEFVAIVGTSGSGKSTLLHMLGGLDRPTEGKVFIDDKDIFALKDEALTILRRRKIGFVFQSFNLIDELSVFENVELPLIYMGVSSSERKKRVKNILERMNISHRASHFPQQLSGGQQQRVAIARALVSNPKLILADEPTGNLDNETADGIMKLLTGINREKGTLIVMVTHNRQIFEKYPGRVMVCKDETCCEQDENEVIDLELTI